MRTLIDILLIFIYLDGAVLDFAVQGKSPLFVLSLSLSISTVIILLAYSLISNMLKHLVCDLLNIKIKDGVASRWADKWHNLSRYKYFIFFVLNLIPFMWLTTSTAIASRFCKNRGLALTSVMIGNALKYVMFVSIYYYVLH